MRTIIISFISLCYATSTFGQTKYQNDFAFYWKTVNENFSYFESRHIDWQKVKQLFQPGFDTVSNRNDFIHLLETVNNELYNGHVFLNTNTHSSNRTIPTGADLKVSLIGNKFIISEIRDGFNAELCGLKEGMSITKFNDQAIDKAILKCLPMSVKKYDKEMHDYAATMLLAGTHDTKRKITIQTGDKEQDFYPDTILNRTETNFTTLLEAKIISNSIGYIKINNSLGNNNLIKSFDTVLDSFINTTALIIDLRETPSGGNTTIARAIMGRFIDKELPYQKHIYTKEEKQTGIKRSTLELVSSRQKTYKKPVVILVGYWTGSMGEGIAIGFDGMKRAKVVGTKMAGLLGEIFTFEMPETKIRFSFPCVKLQHINGQPRESFVPNMLVKDTKSALRIALKLLANKSPDHH